MDEGWDFLVRRVLCGCIAASFALSACEPSPAPPSASSNELLVLLRPGPAAWFSGPHGQNGFDYDLAHRFAKEQGFELKVARASDPLAKLAEGGNNAVIGAGGVYRPTAAATPLMHPHLLYSASYYAVEPVLIYNMDSNKPTTWADLAGDSVAVIADSSLAVALGAVRAEHPEIKWQPMALPSTEALISQVSDGTLDYAIVPSNEADALRNVYLNFERAFAVAAKQDLVWAFPPAQAALRDRVDAFFARLRRDGTLQRLTERYFNYSQMPRLDAGVFQERVKALLPRYRTLFQRAQQTSGVEWRLLAAIAYQESQWDNQAVSETGARGLMQLTEETARQLGASDRLDSEASVLAAARYFRDLKDKLPSRIAEPDRTWLALAAYNVGIAHLEDARVLAQKQKLNPDSWMAVKQALPLLASPEYYEEAKYGYARGGMPVAFVDRVRAYYDVLLAQQAPLQPRLRMFAGATEARPARTEEPTLGSR
ncbi:MAG: membrane-bound lytic murein transglycosylase MltF [Betaproteobacteria bacterium]|nr:MAG: membrane-bound lytic murein transglycosylase MltF [Betaproteobacteria bacterium]